jgi:hypothetical protein
LSANDTLADLNLWGAGRGEVEVGPRAEANHSNSFSCGHTVALLFPANDSSGDEACNLSYKEGAAGSAEEPGLIFVTNIDFKVAGIEELSRGVVGFFDRA